MAESAFGVDHGDISKGFKTLLARKAAKPPSISVGMGRSSRTMALTDTNPVPAVRSAIKAPMLSRAEQHKAREARYGARAAMRRESIMARQRLG